MRTQRDRRSGGSVLLLVILLLLILTVLGVGAVRMASAERVGALTKAKYDRLLACAHAAQAKIWAEVAMYGPGYLTGTQAVTAITLPDGSSLAAPAHYDTLADGSVAVKDVTLVIPEGASGASLPAAADRSNSGGVTTPLGQANRVVARCTDAFGRTFEVELGVRFAF